MKRFPSPEAGCLELYCYRCKGPGACERKELERVEADLGRVLAIPGAIAAHFPEDVFPPASVEEAKKANEVLKEAGLPTLDRFSARAVRNACLMVSEEAERAIHEAWEGVDVEYVSESGRRYRATVELIPVNPGHEGTRLPTVSLSFRNDQGKLVRKARVLPAGVCSKDRQVWRPR
jgi:hypothetical protein